MNETPKSDAYRQEAARLRALAETFVFEEIRNSLTRLAHEYEALAAARGNFGSPTPHPIEHGALAPEPLSFGGLIDNTAKLP